MADDGKRSSVAVVKEYFSTEDRPVTNAELIALKKSDSTGQVLATLADGIENGTFTY